MFTKAAGNVSAEMEALRISNLARVKLVDACLSECSLPGLQQETIGVPETGGSGGFLTATARVSTPTLRKATSSCWTTSRMWRQSALGSCCADYLFVNIRSPTCYCLLIIQTSRIVLVDSDSTLKTKMTLPSRKCLLGVSPSALVKSHCCWYNKRFALCVRCALVLHFCRGPRTHISGSALQRWR